MTANDDYNELCARRYKPPGSVPAAVKAVTSEAERAEHAETREILSA